MLTRYEQQDLLWIDLISPTPAEVRSLMHEFKIDPSVAQELLVPSFRQKVERRGEVIYAILNFPALRTVGQRPEHEIDFIIGKRFLITTRYEGIDPLHAFARAFEVNAILGRGRGATHGGHLFIELARDLYRALAEETLLLQRRLSDIEEQIYNNQERQMVLEISHTGRIIHDFRQSLLPHREMLASLEPAATRVFGAEFSYHVRDLLGVFEQVDHALQNVREALHELRETNNSLLSTKQNEAIKILTMMAFVTFPLSLLVGIFSLDTTYVPIVGQNGDFWIILGIMGGIVALFYIFFKRKGWL